jgi:uncharacterized protein YdhG (YjbR/CyaY superfamily)
VKRKQTAATRTPVKTVDEYIAKAPENQRAVMAKLRKTIKAAAPNASESIAYGMAGFKYKGKPLIYFANWKDHVALYGSFADEYADELKAFELAKGTVRFPPDHPPSDRLLTRIVKGRVAAIDAAR